MPSFDIADPVSPAPTDRLTLGVRWARPGAAGIGGALAPSSQGACICCGVCCSACFEGNEE
ncbi:unannotated protein [freshwater metagenome]|uniref:Unannotated protein n=1 Tax=freshwater metagenome TaxID=449393 RepID=A0A6J7AC48_9ZZZZ